MSTLRPSCHSAARSRQCRIGRTCIAGRTRPRTPSATRRSIHRSLHALRIGTRRSQRNPAHRLHPPSHGCTLGRKRRLVLLRRARPPCPRAQQGVERVSSGQSCSTRTASHAYRLVASAGASALLERTVCAFRAGCTLACEAAMVSERAHAAGPSTPVVRFRPSCAPTKKTLHPTRPVPPSSMTRGSATVTSQCLACTASAPAVSVTGGDTLDARRRCSR